MGAPATSAARVAGLKRAGVERSVGSGHHLRGGSGTSESSFACPGFTPGAGAPVCLGGVGTSLMAETGPLRIELSIFVVFIRCLLRLGVMPGQAALTVQSPWMASRGQSPFPTFRTQPLRLSRGTGQQSP
jgi:hypothetical protein